MLKKLSFLLFLVLLGIALFLNPNFKTIAAGISILLFGMILLEQGFKVFTKGFLKNILKKVTNKIYKSITVGAIVTAILNSSSLVSVITISFISAGLISLSGGIGLIFGANIGSTATSWLVAAFGLKINIATLAMPMLVFGLIFSFQKKEVLKGLGNVLAGLGFFFLGIYFMKDGFDIFSESIDLTKYAIPGFLGVLVYTGLGIVLTTILQSSAATMALVLTALSAGQIEYENALALAIGANIGTTITAILGAVSSNIAGKRLAAAHVIFNLTTAIFAIIFLTPIGNFVNYFAGILGISQTDFTLKLALFHTVFNILGVLLMIPFIKKLETILVKFMKEKVLKDVDEPKYLNEAVLKFPSATIYALTEETKHLYKYTIFEIVTHGLHIHRDDIKSDEKIKKIIAKSHENMQVDVNELYYKKVKNIYSEILKYASAAQELDLNKKLNAQITDIKIANRKMVEIVKDVRELNKNVTFALNQENKYLIAEYDVFRKMVIKVLRVIYLFRTQDDEKYAQKLYELKKEAKLNVKKNNSAIDKLIRKNLITAEMASSLFNDYFNVNEIVKLLIDVAEILYENKDNLLENNAFPKEVFVK
jgi:phosphate:Na+ symporter